MSIRLAVVMAVALLAWPGLGCAHDAPDDQRLPTIGPAPDFTLISQNGATTKLADFRGMVVAVTFIFTSCVDTCPLLTAKMAEVQDALGPAFGSTVAFVSITVDPAHDTPEVLQRYADDFGADPDGWSFLTGSADEIRDVMRRYGVFASRSAGRDVDHTFLTSIVDQHGILRVQYLGVRFDPEEFRHDLLSLLEEPD